MATANCVRQVDQRFSSSQLLFGSMTEALIVGAPLVLPSQPALATSAQALRGVPMVFGRFSSADSFWRPSRRPGRSDGYRDRCHCPATAGRGSTYQLHGDRHEQGFGRLSAFPDAGRACQPLGRHQRHDRKRRGGAGRRQLAGSQRVSSRAQGYIPRLGNGRHASGPDSVSSTDVKEP